MTGRMEGNGQGRAEGSGQSRAGGRKQRAEKRVAVHREVAGGLAELVPDLDRPGSWLLYLEDAPQSQVDLDDPTYLEFEYVQRIAHLLDTIAPAGTPLRVLHLGGGALTVPRYVAATRPGSSQLVAEYDAALMDLVRQHLPLGRARHRIRVRIGDAREVLGSVRPGRFDVVISDVFAGARTPPHLTTAECVQLAARALAADGVLIQNVADGPPLAFAKQQVATVASAFPYRLVVAEPAVLRRRRFGNLVLAGSRRELPAGELRRLTAADAFPARVMDGADLDRFVAGAHPATDATAQPSPMPPPAVLTGPGEYPGD